jgi:adenosylhomocysteinase
MTQHELKVKNTLLSPNTPFRIFKSQLDIDTVHKKVDDLLKKVTKEHDISLIQNKNQYILRGEEDILHVLLQTAPPQTRSVLPFSSPPTIPTEVLVSRIDRFDKEEINSLICKIEITLSELEDVLSDREVDLIINSMPLLKVISSSGNDMQVFSNFALIWRDHFLEENIALLQGFERAGISPEWFYALSKGDQTAKCERIAAYFKQRGYHTDILDSTYPTEQIQKREVERITSDLTCFIQNARRVGKKVMVVDDGGLLFFCFRHNQRMIDFAIEVTIIGSKRLLQLPSIDIPIFDIGRSKLKEVITYPEIAESGVMRVREMIPAEKLRGRQVLVLGYGTSGRQVARIFHSIGCKVSIVDTDILALIEAAENGLRTFKSAYMAINEIKPFLVFGCTGEIALTYNEFNALPDGAFITAIATKDLSELRNRELPYEVTPLPNFGYEYKSKEGKRFYQLGDGRSFNLFLSEAIPNRANDVFKSGIFVVAKDLSERFYDLNGGIYVEEADLAIKKSGLLDLYYNTYLKD